MTRNKLASSLLALSLAGCGAELAQEQELDGADLGSKLALGKADSAASEVGVFTNGITLRGAAARTLYNILDTAGAQAQTGNGNRTLFAQGLGCITNGLATYCEMYGAAESGNGAYEGLIHGQGAASTLYDLLAEGSGQSFVSTPWFACERAGGSAWCGVEASTSVTIEFDGLEDSGDSFVYEGWAVSGGVATTTDRFRAGGSVEQRLPLSIADSSLYVLTIEPRRGDDPAPAATHLVAGPLTRNVSEELTTEHPAALNTDFADALGGFILATPSSTSTDDEENGIWFVDPAAGAATLDLPTLPEGWAYEGWIVTADGPVSTGRFVDPAAADSDAGGPAAGPEGTPPFPGQDFVSPAMNLVDTTVVISVEPEPDNSPAPFAIKPLIGEIGNELAPTVQDIANTSENRPSATATLH